MASSKFQAEVTFELVEDSRKWATYKVGDRSRGHIGYFRLNREHKTVDDRDSDGVLQLGGWFAKVASTEDFADRHDLLNWVVAMLEEFLTRAELPKYQFVST